MYDDRYFDDSEGYADTIERMYLSGKDETIITFGNYPQGEDGSRFPIEWVVLDIDEKENHALLISKYGLDAKAFHDGGKYPTWAKSSIRAWLNGEFLNDAFSAEEQKAIVTANISTPDYKKNSGGEDTQDKVWLLSLEEAAKYFANDVRRRAIPTQYAVANGAQQYVDGLSNCILHGIECCSWWLRSPGFFSDYASYVDDSGGTDGTFVDYIYDAVRPALWLNLQFRNLYKEEKRNPLIKIERNLPYISRYKRKNDDTEEDQEAEADAVSSENCGTDLSQIMQVKVRRKMRMTRCKDCGTINYTDSADYYECDSCGAYQKLPKIKEDCKAEDADKKPAGKSKNLKYAKAPATCDAGPASKKFDYREIPREIRGNFALTRRIQKVAAEINRMGRKIDELSDLVPEVEQPLKALQKNLVEKTLEAYRVAELMYNSLDADEFVITFGSYPQAEDGSRLPIEWIVLEIDNKNRALLLSKYGLEAKAFRNKDRDRDKDLFSASGFGLAAWNESDIRAWLNGEFLNEAFSAEEQKFIGTAKNRTKNYNGVEGGPQTADKVWLLSREEAAKYFKSNKAREAGTTKYMQSKRGQWLCGWWLRSPGKRDLLASTVEGDGKICDEGYIYADSCFVRPALWLDLSRVYSSLLRK